MFDVIPAIDLQSGRCVRLVQGDFAQATVYGDDPPGVARRWEAAGARRIHVVDLDGAREGRPMQLGVVGDIVKAVDIPVQLGGGLRSLDDVEAALEAGVDRVILGTAALEDEWLLDTSLARFGSKIVVGIDARGGQVAVRGWVDVSCVDAYRFAAAMCDKAVQTIVYTDISRDGLLGGPNLPAMQRMATTVPSVSVIASGGVGKIEDVVALSATGASGVIVGKALYTGAVDLAEAIWAVDSAAASLGSTGEC